jgi:hypothetical protein
VKREIPTVGKQGEKAFLVCWIDHLLPRTSEPVAVFANAVGKYAKDMFGRGSITKLVLQRFAMAAWVAKYVVAMKQTLKDDWMASRARQDLLKRLIDTNWPMPKHFEKKRFAEDSTPTAFVDFIEQQQQDT